MQNARVHRGIFPGQITFFLSAHFRAHRRTYITHSLILSTKWLEMTHPASHGWVRMYRVPSKAAFLRRLSFAKAREKERKGIGNVAAYT